MTLTRPPRSLLILLFATLLAAAAGAAFFARGVPVDVVEARGAPLRQTVVVSGRVLAPAKVQVGATITGRVDGVAVDEGDRVAAGRTMITLETAELDAALAQARANERAAETRIRQWNEVDATSAKEQLRQAEANHAVAQRHAARQEELFSKGFVGEAALDEARRALAIARSQLATARAGAEANAPTGSSRRLLEDQLRSARAARESAEAKLGQARIAAPAPGMVLDRAVEPGDIVQPGKTLMTLAIDGPARLTALVDEKNLALLRIGQKARASADAFPAQRFEATLDYLSPGVDVQRGTVEARFTIADPPAFLRADMTVSIDVAVADKSNAVLIPASAVRDGQTLEPWVLVVDDGHASRRPVEIGGRTASDVEVVRGVAQGERVIVTPNVAPGASVRVRG